MCVCEKCVVYMFAKNIFYYISAPSAPVNLSAESCGLTALHYAARRGDMDIVKVLMEYAVFERSISPCITHSSYITITH